MKSDKCSRCSKPGDVELKYSGKFLCNSCFVRLFEKRVRKTIRLGKLLGPKDKIAVALSGGKDSSTALHVLKELSEKIPSSELVAITIDLGIRGYQKKALGCAKEFCRELGVRHYVYSFKEELGFTLDDAVRKSKRLDKPAPGCSYCGVFRRKVLNDKCQELGITKIATGHNLDDEVQAAMMNFIRSDWNRVARMGPIVGVVNDIGFVPRTKPLRNCPENEVRTYAKIKGLEFYSGKCPHSGEALRGSVREAIDRIDRNHPGSKFQLLKSTDNLVGILREYKKFGGICKCKKCGDPTSAELCKACELRKLLDI
ncbi:MAG: TIGR00269 family protein [Candidatus Altiarchaeales archaeon]|nr:TIGR00269 family protein [Candidatus Altiarchaeota archaeon]MBU4341816.1 TIGR00269 family protein [Candidatus Altiarchaeota archaeon]MBU4437095.1 TIGR00269 family protein [Candidatus Altiarchaeota archaeon]MCG2782709.1 TIGR00269 family protein [Candidatus Altiarchaeales archaeon]